MLKPLRIFALLSISFILTGRAQNLTVTAKDSWSKGAAIDLEKLKTHTDEKITSVVIHHTQTPNEPARMTVARLKGVQHYHSVDRKWGDIAYHYLIGPDGTIYEGRNTKYQGSSGTAYKLDGRLLICMLGDFRKRKPSEVSLNNLINFVAEQMKAHQIPTKELYTHQELASTTCPGEAFQKWFETEGKAKIQAQHAKVIQKK